MWLTCLSFFLLLNTAQSKIEWKPGTERNKLFPEYGTNFRYVGELKNNLDRVTVVTSIPIPRYSDLQIVPIQFTNCSIDFFEGPLRAVREELFDTIQKWCAHTVHYMEHLKKKEEYYLGRLHDLLELELYAALPELRQSADLQKKRKRRGLGIFLSALPGLITLAVESISSFLKSKQERHITDAVKTMRQDQGSLENRLQQYSNDFLMYGRYNVESLDKIIDTVNSLHAKQTELEKFFANSEYGQLQAYLDTMSFGFDLQMYMKIMEEEHANQYQLLEVAAKELLRGIATLGQGHLPQELFPDDRLRSMLKEVSSMVKKQFPDYELAADHISHYRDMKLVTFAVDKQAHSLIVSFPVFVKDYKRTPLAMYEIESVHVPIKDKNGKADSYTRVQIRKPYIAAGDDYYIQLRMPELWMCKSIRHIYYCEDLFVIKHKTKHSCASAIFYRLGHKLINHNCEFEYFFNETVPPVILDGGKKLLLANFHGPRTLQCPSENGGLARPIPDHTYAVVHREFLCDCQLDLEHASLLRQLSACGTNGTARLSMHFVLNMGFYQMLHEEKPELVRSIKPRMHTKQQTFSLRLSRNPSQPLDKAENLREVIERISEGRSHSRHNLKLQAFVPKSYSYIISVMTALVAIILFVSLILLAFKHHKLKTLVNSLALSVIPAVEAKATHDRVICSNPQITALASVITIMGILFWLYSQCKSLTWLRGYRYNRCCTLYVFLYNSHFYVPIKLRKLTGHMNMYRLMNAVGPDGLSYSKAYLWDIIHFDWHETCLYMNSQIVSLPTSVTIPLKDKIRARRMINKEDLDLQFMIKQGTNWYSLSKSSVIESP